MIHYFPSKKENRVIVSSVWILLEVAVVLKRFFTCSLLEIYSRYLKSTLSLSVAYRLKFTVVLETHSVVIPDF